MNIGKFKEPEKRMLQIMGKRKIWEHKSEFLLYITNLYLYCWNLQHTHLHNAERKTTAADFNTFMMERHFPTSVARALANWCLFHAGSESWSF
jgi:hypothetical protein